MYCLGKLRRPHKAAAGGEFVQLGTHGGGICLLDGGVDARVLFG